MISVAESDDLRGSHAAQRGLGDQRSREFGIVGLDQLYGELPDTAGCVRADGQQRTGACIQCMLFCLQGTHSVDSVFVMALSESERIMALRRLDILDSADEPEFDDLVSLAAAICDVPVSLVSLVDADRQWFKAALGVSVRQTSRSIAFCDHTIQQDGLFVVPDAKADLRFCSNPLVTGEANWQFYAGVPLTTIEGYAVGTLCVADHCPRELTEQQRNALRVLADQVSTRLALRSERKALQASQANLDAAYRESQRIQQLFESFMDSGPFVSYMKDAAGRMLYYNEQLAARFGVSREAMLGRTDEELWPAEQAAAFRMHDLSVLKSGEPSITIEKTLTDDGDVTVWQSYKFPCTGSDGQKILGGVSIDITDRLRKEEELLRTQAELKKANSILAELATTDTLTGLPLRRVFDECFRVAFRRARRSRKAFSLLMIDVDDFKRHNDVFGHPHGDEVLRCLAKTLKDQLRPVDFLARFGGEEFVVGAPDIDIGGAEALASRLLDAVHAISVEGQAITISIGIAELQDDANTKDLLKRADDALLCAKASGKDRFSLAT